MQVQLVDFVVELRMPHEGAEQMRSQCAVISHDLVLVGNFSLAFVYSLQDCLTDKTSQVIAVARQQATDAWLAFGMRRNRTGSNMADRSILLFSVLCSNKSAFPTKSCSLDTPKAAVN